MKQIKTEIVIDSTPEKIWEVLMDFNNYPNWNPFIQSIEGEQSINGRLKVSIHPPDGKPMTFTPKIQVFEPNKRLIWLGSGPIKWLFDGLHSFELEKTANGQIKFIHQERFTGILVGAFKKTLVKTEIGFNQMNQALKKACESQ